MIICPPGDVVWCKTWWVKQTQVHHNRQTLNVNSYLGLFVRPKVVIQENVLHCEENDIFDLCQRWLKAFTNYNLQAGDCISRRSEKRKETIQFHQLVGVWVKGQSARGGGKQPPLLEKLNLGSCHAVIWPQIRHRNVRVRSCCESEGNKHRTEMCKNI